MKALIVYGTRYGASAATSEEIGRVLQGEGFDVKVCNVKEERIDSVAGYDVVVVGGGLQIGRWTSESEDFLKKFQKDLANKKLAIFVSSAMYSLYAREGKTEENAKNRKIYLEDKPAKLCLRPIMTAMFGGFINDSKMGFIAKRGFGPFKKNFAAVGFKEEKPGFIDTRDCEEIRGWTKELALKAVT